MTQTDTIVNLADLGCGELVIALMKALKPLDAGQVIEIRSADPGAVQDIPAWCRMTGNELLAGPTGSEGQAYIIRKKG